MEEKTDIWEQLIIKGIEVIFAGINSNKDLKQKLVEKYPHIIHERLHNLSVEIQRTVVENILRTNPDKLKEPFWASYVDKALVVFSDSPRKYIHEHSAWFVLLNRIRDLREEVDWFNVLVVLGEAAIDQGTCPMGFSTVLGWLIDADKENLLKLLHRGETKKYPRSMKTNLYKRLVNLGLLDLKVARRIRSDSSGELSAEVLSYLFESRHLYDAEFFKDLIMQFTDTKHKWVARYIAINMPSEMTPFLFALDDDIARKILERRQYADED